MGWFLFKILRIPNVLRFLKSLFRKLFLESGSTSSPSDGDNDIAYEPPPESQPTPSASSSDQIKVVIDSGTVKPQHVQSSSKASNKVSDQNSKESSPLLPIFSSNQPSTVSYTPSKPSASSSGTVKPQQHVQSSSKGSNKVSDQNSKESSPLLPIFSSNQPSTVSYTPSKPSASSSGTVKPQHVQSSSKGTDKVSDQNSKESSPLLPIFSSNQPSTVSYTPSKPSASSSGTVKPQHVQSSSKGTDKVSDQNSKESSPLLNTISSNQPTVSYAPLQSPSKPSASSGISSSGTVKPQHVQSSFQIRTNDVSHSSLESALTLHLKSSYTSLQSSSKPPPSSLKPPLDSSISYVSFPKTTEPPSTSDPPLPFTKQPPAFKPILHTAPKNVTNEERKMSYMCEKGTPIYAIPEDFKSLIKRDIVPPVLKQPLSPSTYKDYFAALLYAEDYYLEKWSDFLLKKVTLELEEAAILKKSNKDKYYNGSGEKDDKTFVQFKIDSVPEKRPFLLSRDMVYARPSGKEVEPFQGLIYRVVKGNCVLVEFGDDFHSQHHPNRKYDISFSFNRVCLKRAHQAVEAALDPLSNNFLFPECISRKYIPAFLGSYHDLNTDDEFNSVHRILSFRGSPPYLLGGPPILTDVKKSFKSKELSSTGVVVREAVIQMYRTSEENRILICAPINHTCDVLMENLMKVIPESDMFRANAAFREIDEVPIDILRSCPVKDECFACPSLRKLRKFKIILSTFVSSFRLYNQGITAGHFSHIFLVDASSTTEPEATIALANFANENTTVIVTGAPRNRSDWVRSNMARKYGLGKSYFERLHEREPYKIRNPMFITELVHFE
ncbi:putative helicase MOV-10 [Fagus crenata]